MRGSWGRSFRAPAFGNMSYVLAKRFSLQNVAAGAPNNSAQVCTNAQIAANAAPTAGSAAATAATEGAATEGAATEGAGSAAVSAAIMGRAPISIAAPSDAAGSDAAGSDAAGTEDDGAGAASSGDAGAGLVMDVWFGSALAVSTVACARMSSATISATKRVRARGAIVPSRSVSTVGSRPGAIRLTRGRSFLHASTRMRVASNAGS